MNLLLTMKTFAAVVDEGSFAAAARALNIAKSVVSRHIDELEGHLQARLLNRTTRRLSLTDIGENYLERARRILEDLEEASSLVSSATSNPAGVVRLLVPPAIAVHQLAKHLPTLLARYTLLGVEISSPGPVADIDDSHDITILQRSSSTPLEGDFIARRLVRSELVLCASPEYLNRFGRPQTPADLSRHSFLGPVMGNAERGMALYRAGADSGQPEQLLLNTSPPRVRTAHTDTLYASALYGLGIVPLPSYMIEDALLEHALERVLPSWRLGAVNLWAALPTRRYMPARTRVVLDFLVEIFGGEDRDPWSETTRA